MNPFLDQRVLERVRGRVPGNAGHAIDPGQIQRLCGIEEPMCPRSFWTHSSERSFSVGTRTEGTFASLKAHCRLLAPHKPRCIQGLP